MIEGCSFLLGLSSRKSKKFGGSSCTSLLTSRQKSCPPLLAGAVDVALKMSGFPLWWVQGVVVALKTIL